MTCTICNLTAFVLAALFVAGPALAGDPVEDAMDICTRLADDLAGRVSAFEARGWAKAADPAGMALALAEGDVLVHPPNENTGAAWSERLSEAAAKSQTWPQVLERGGSYVFLGPLAPIDPENHATCIFAGTADAAIADIFSEADALGTMEHPAGVHHGRISRTVRDGAGKGWITVILLAAIAEDAAPGQKIGASARLTFVNGPVRH